MPKLLIQTTRLRLFAFKDGLVFLFTEHEVTRSLIRVVLADRARVLVVQSIEIKFHILLRSYEFLVEAGGLLGQVGRLDSVVE